MYLSSQPREKPDTNEYLSRYSEGWRHKDLLLLLLSNWNVERLKAERLHEIWRFFLHSLKKKGVEVQGFYRDEITGHYRALDSALQDLLQMGFLDLHLNSPGYFFFGILPRTRAAIREGIPDEVLQVVDEVSPIILRLWRNEIDECECLKALRIQRNPIPA